LIGITHNWYSVDKDILLSALMFKLSTNSAQQDYFTARQLCVQSLWQPEFVDRGNSCDEITSIEATNIKSLHLLPLNLCGKVTAITPLMLVS
jgi:hypothetical protein